MDTKTYIAFTLGLLVAEHVHGLRRPGGDDTARRRFEATLEAVARGDLTLLDTPEEMLAHQPVPPDIAEQAPELADQLRAALQSHVHLLHRNAARDHRAVAEDILGQLRAASLPPT